jgi:hypothetical protein
MLEWPVSTRQNLRAYLINFFWVESKFFTQPFLFFCLIEKRFVRILRYNESMKKK